MTLLLRCDNVYTMPDCVLVGFNDVQGRARHLHVEESYLHQVDGRYWLPVVFIRKEDTDGGRIALVQLPKPDQWGDKQIWVGKKQLRKGGT